MIEYMDIVNEKNEIVGSTTKDEIYEKKIPHRIVHILVINPKTNQVYFQKRSETKSFLPGYYCTSAGGHVQSGESYQNAAKRELVEEIGIKAELKKATDLEFEDSGHKRFIQLFVAYAEEGFEFRDGEVASGEFLDLDKAKELIDKNEKIHPQLSVCFNWYYKNQQSLRT